MLTFLTSMKANLTNSIWTMILNTCKSGNKSAHMTIGKVIYAMTNSNSSKLLKKWTLLFQKTIFKFMKIWLLKKRKNRDNLISKLRIQKNQKLRKVDITFHLKNIKLTLRSRLKCSYKSMMTLIAWWRDKRLEIKFVLLTQGFLKKEFRALTILLANKRPKNDKIL